MESSVSTNLDSRPSQLKQQTLPSRKRKVVERSVVRVKMGENIGKVKNEGPPSDSWSWRKYGQKPIKGSPFPRGYYRCSTSKGCSAKKQVERCKTDASVLVITYTSTHNHPTHQNSKQNDQPLKSPKRTDTDEEEEEAAAAAAAEEEQESEEMQGQGYEEMRKEEDQAILEATSHEGEEHYFHYIESPLRSLSVQDMINQDMMMSTLEFVFDEEPINMISCSIHHNMIKSPKSEGNDFFDELEELPTALPFTSLTRSNCFQETIPPVQS